MANNECDDGNLNNGDGCSKICEYEKCYECKGGSSSFKDVCSKLEISAVVGSISDSNIIKIYFNHTMRKADITLKDLSISISASYPVSYNWTANYENQTSLIINTNVNTVLQGGELITIKFTNYKVWRGPNGGCLITEVLTANAISSLISAENTASSMSGFAQYSAYLGVVVALLLVIIGGGSMEMVWALLNTMQLISYLPIMTPFFPNHVRIMFQILKFANLNFEFLSSAFQSLLPIDLTPDNNVSDILKNNGIDSPLFLLNCASILFTLLCYAFFFFLLIVLRYTVWNNKLKNFFQKIVSSFIFNNCLRFLIEGYLEIFFGSVLNVTSFSNKSLTELISFLFSAIFAIICFIYPFMSAALIYDNRKEIMKGNELYLKRYGAMYKNLKQDHSWYHLQFYPIFLLRRFVFVMFLILLEGLPEIQCNIFIFSSLLMLTYVVIAKPFHHKVDNILMIVNEVSILCISMTQVIFITNSKTLEVVNSTGWAMIGLCATNVLINFGICIVYNIREKAIKCMKSSRVQNEQQSNLDMTSVNQYETSSPTLRNKRRLERSMNSQNNKYSFDAFSKEIRKAGRIRIESEDKF